MSEEKLQLVIKVAGPACSGKTTISKLIYDALIEKGFEVNLDLLDEVDVSGPSYQGLELKYRAKEIIRKTAITISEVQTPRCGGSLTA